MKQSTKNRIEAKAQIWKRIIANQVFKDYFYSKNLQETCAAIRKHSGVIKKYLDWLNYYAHSKGWGVDTRSGKETYGYKDLESIEGNLDYISDRFGGEFRLQWMLELPNEVDNLLKNS